MKLRTQIVSFGMAGTLLAAVTGGLGLYAAARLDAALQDVVRAGQALQASQQADMMHDAIRADAQRAMMSAQDGAPDGVADSAKDLVEHAGVFRGALGRLDELPIPPESQRALKAALPAMQAYVAAAEHVIEQARAGADRIDTPSKTGLQDSFTLLEGLMAALSETIEKHGDAHIARSQAVSAQARLMVGVALGLSMAMLLGLALWLATRMTRPMAHAVAVAESLAQGDLTRPIHHEGNDEILRLLEALAGMQRNLAGIVQDVKSNAELVASATMQIAQANEELSARTIAQAGSLEQTVSAMQDLDKTVRTNADSANAANQLALGAAGVASKGGEVMSQVVDTVTGINDSSRRIADIISVIDGIAFQTNILALNAAVEAARAGEQGRGFAVVASEVRGLAQRTAEAAREVKTLVTDSVERVERGTTLVDEAGQTMTEIVESIRRVSSIVAEISSASMAQSSGVVQMTQAVAQMGVSTQHNAAQVEENAAATQSLNTQAQELVKAVGIFQLRDTPAGKRAQAFLT